MRERDGSEVVPDAVVYDVAQSEARRHIVGVLQRRRGPLSFAELTEAVATTDAHDGMATLERSAIALYHVHLPKLSNGGFVSWDVAGDEIRPTDRFDALAEVVDALSHLEDSDVGPLADD